MKYYYVLRLKLTSIYICKMETFFSDNHSAQWMLGKYVSYCQNGNYCSFNFFSLQCWLMLSWYSKSWYSKRCILSVRFILFLFCCSGRECRVHTCWGDQSREVREQQKWRNPIDCSPGNGINKRRGASVSMNHSCHQLIGQKLRAGQHHTKICKGLGVSRSMVIKVLFSLYSNWVWRRESNPQHSSVYLAL